MKAKCPSKAIPAKPQIVLYGEPGDGKTTFALNFPKPLVIDTEGGANLSHYTRRLQENNGLYLGSEDGSTNFAAVIDEVRCLTFEEHDRETLVIDSLSRLFHNAVRQTFWELERQGKPAAFGAEKKPALNLVRKLLQQVDLLHMNVVLVAHSVPKYEGDEIVGTMPDLPKECIYDLNLMIETFRRGKSRYARVHKSRYPQFEIGDVFELSMEAFQDKWRKRKSDESEPKI